MQPDAIPDDPRSVGFEGHVADVRQQAIELRGAQELGIYTRTGKRWVLVGVSRPGAAGVLCIPKEEYDGLKVAELAGFLPVAKAPPDADQIRQELEHARSRPQQRKK